MAISDELRKLVDPNNECCCEHCLSNKCKEWANNLPSKRYQLYSGICPKSLNYSVCSIFSGAIEQTEEIIANSEVEAIIKACQWILDNKESN